MTDEVLATLHASPARRVIGVGFMLFLGALIIYLGFSEPVALGWRLYLFVTGIALLYLAQMM